MNPMRPKDHALKIADKLALDPNREEYRLVHLVGAEYDEALCGNQPQTDDGMTINDHLVTCRACLNALSDARAAPLPRRSHDNQSDLRFRRLRRGGHH